MKNKVKALEKRCLEMANKCKDLMGKYELMLRRTTQVEMSVGILRSRFETYPPQQFDLTVLVEQTRGQRQTGRNDLPGRVRELLRWMVRVESKKC